MSRKKITALVVAALMFTTTLPVSAITNGANFEKKETSNEISAIEDVVEGNNNSKAKEVVQYSNGDNITIKAAKEKEKGEEVAIKGVITSRIGNNAFIQDETSGIYIYAGKENLKELSKGNVVAITGIVDEFNGTKQLKDIKSIKLDSENCKLPKAKEIAASDVPNDELLGSLITVKNMIIKKVNNGKDKNGKPTGYDIIVTDGTSNVNLRVDKWLEPYIESSEFKVGDKVDVTAPLSKFKTNYQMMVSSLDDVKVVGKGEEIPTAPTKKISEIQGKAHRSPLENQDVSEVEGVVTTISIDKYQKGFYMQSTSPDNDKATSEGIFVSYKQNSLVKPGYIVRVNGTVKELLNDSNKDSTGLTETIIDATKVDIFSKNNKIPKPIEIDMQGNLLENIDDDNLKDFDPEDDAIDYYESLEGMLVNIKDPLIVGADDRYGEISVLANNGQASKCDLTRNGGIKADKKGEKEDFNPEIMTIDDVIVPISNKNGFLDKNMKVSVGDKFLGDVSGVMSYGFGKYKVLNTEKLPEIQHGKTEREVATINQAKDKVTVASYNIENFNKNEASKVNGIARDIVENLKTPDIMGLIEVQDNDGDKDSGITSASENYEALIKVIKDLSGVEYGFVEIAPEDNKDGGAPGGNIRPGFIYRKDRVKLVDKQVGDTKTDVQATENGLSVNPGRIGNNNPAFDSSRKSLAAEFEFNGEKVVVIANHLASKRGDQYLFGSAQPPKMESEIKRVEQAKVINKFIQELQEKNPKANVVALGDMNDFEFSNTVKTLEGNQMKDMINKLDRLDRFTYVYGGNSQVLDHILVSKNLEDKTDVDVVNINSQFTRGYGRLSDHDPVLVQIALNSNQGTGVVDPEKPVNPGEGTKPNNPEKPVNPGEETKPEENENNLENKLPQTGGVSSSLYLLTGIALCAGGYTLTRKGRKKEILKKEDIQ